MKNLTKCQMSDNIQPEMHTLTSATFNRQVLAQLQERGRHTHIMKTTQQQQPGIEKRMLGVNFIIK